MKNFSIFLGILNMISNISSIKVVEDTITMISTHEGGEFYLQINTPKSFKLYSIEKGHTIYEKATTIEIIQYFLEVKKEVAA